MTKEEIAAFIEIREEIGDIWTEDQVKASYGDSSLSEALAERRACDSYVADIFQSILN